MKNSFSLKFKSFLRKRGASLKRNFYTLPFILICICCFFFLSSLFVFIKSVNRIDYKASAIFLFIATLAIILSVIAVINYTKKVYGQKRPIKMLVIYFILAATCIAFSIAVFYFNEQQVAQEIIKRDALPTPGTSEWIIYQTYINYGVCTKVLLIIFFVLEAIANGFLIAGPIFEKKLKSMNFDKPLQNETRE